ncbi:MAG: ABC transporter substrate-binding protein [Candidatus Bipolaricaulaceae bacterium]
MRKTLWLVLFLALASPAASPAPLRVSLPPLLGSVPIALGNTWRAFAEQGVEVELVPLASQRDRLVAFQAGQIDAMVADLTSALMLAAQIPEQLVITSTAYYPEPDSVPGMTHSHLALISQQYAGVDSLAALVDQASKRSALRIAVPRQSDLEFALDQLFLSQGLPPPVHAYAGQDNLLQNATWVMFGMAAAGVFPEPYTDYMLNYDFEGKPQLTILSDFSGVPYPPSVIVFQRETLTVHGEQVAAFYRALTAVIDQLNATARQELIQVGWTMAAELFFPGLSPENMPAGSKAQVEAALAKVVIPHFPHPAPIPEEVFAAVTAWAKEKKYLAATVEYEQVVDFWGS